MHSDDYEIKEEIYVFTVLHAGCSKAGNSKTKNFYRKICSVGNCWKHFYVFKRIIYTLYTGWRKISKKKSVISVIQSMQSP